MLYRLMLRSSVTSVFLDSAVWFYQRRIDFLPGLPTTTWQLFLNALIYGPTLQHGGSRTVEGPSSRLGSHISCRTRRTHSWTSSSPLFFFFDLCLADLLTCEPKCINESRFLLLIFRVSTNLFLRRPPKANFCCIQGKGLFSTPWWVVLTPPVVNENRSRCGCPDD